MRARDMFFTWVCATVGCFSYAAVMSKPWFEAFDHSYWLGAGIFLVGLFRSERAS